MVAHVFGEVWTSRISWKEQGPSLCTYSLSGITCLPLPEHVCIQLVSGLLHCWNFGKAFSSPKCELSYRLLPWNLEMENFVDVLTRIEPASPPFWASVLTTTPQHHGTKCIKFMTVYSLFSPFFAIFTKKNITKGFEKSMGYFSCTGS